VYITEVFNTKKVSKNEKLDVKKLCKQIHSSSYAEGIYCNDPQDLVAKLKKILPKFKDEKVAVLAMSNGSFGGIYPDLIKIAQSRKD
jgi:UDP-N-acetylmuramate: L-alanyl-gamma-D-glutamyl-meso-diaminopimelate ligase